MSACPFTEALAPAHRADPYVLFAQMPAVPTRIEDGRFVVRGHAQVMRLLGDPRLSSAGAREGDEPDQAMNLLRLDPPEHDRLRRIMMRAFGPPERPGFVAGFEARIEALAHALLDGFAGATEFEAVSGFAYRIPLSMICAVLGVPETDAATFRAWIEIALGESCDAGDAGARHAGGRRIEDYLARLAAGRRGGDGTDMLSLLVNDDGPEGLVPEASLGAMARLLLIAGHETTVNLIGNGILTLIAHPEQAARLAGDRVRAALVVEELLRLEPPVQFIPTRTALADIVLDGVTMPAGSTVVLLVAAANRDPAVFRDPDRFDPDRVDTRHLAFGAGVHGCFGAALARLEAQVALRVFFERVRGPRLAAALRYRANAVLRGPREIVVAHDGIEGA